MLCQKCKINNANVKVIRNVNGDVKEYFLCSSCAESEGMGFSHGFKDIIPESFFNMLAPESRGVAVCPGCKMSYPEFKKNLKFGCEKCVDSFGEMLPDMIKNIQGSTLHTGKIPKRSGSEFIIKKKISDLKIELNKAVAEENFELAAKLRDEIRELDK